MLKCPRCGKEYPDVHSSCPADDTALVKPDEPDEPAESYDSGKLRSARLQQPPEMTGRPNVNIIFAHRNAGRNRQSMVKT